MIARFVWFYLRVLLAISIGIAFGASILGWKYGFQPILSGMLGDVGMDMILVLVIALVATIAHFALERRKE